MAHYVTLPKLGTNMTEAQVVRWLKGEGEPVAAGDVVVEVETEKAVFEVEAEASGVLRHILAAPGETVPVAMPIAIIAEAGEDTAPHLAEARRLAAGRDQGRRHTAEVYAQWRAPQQDSAAPAPVGPAPAEQGQRAAATPAARRLARELGVDLAELARSLPRGQTLREEHVREAARARQPVPLAVFGAGLGASQVMDVVRFLPEFRLVALVDDNEALWGSRVSGYPVYGVEWLRRAVERGEVRAVAVSLHSEHRRKVVRRLREACPSLAFPPLVHPRAYLGEGVVVEEGVLVEAGAVVGNGTVLREGVIVDVGAVVSHHCDIGAFTHLAPGCTLSGAVQVKEHAVIMAGAVVANTATVGRNVVVTPGSVVASDAVPDDVVVHGNPARVIGKSKRGA